MLLIINTEKIFNSVEKRSIRFENNFVQRVLATSWGDKSPWPFGQVSHEKNTKFDLESSDARVVSNETRTTSL